MKFDPGSISTVNHEYNIYYLGPKMSFSHEAAKKACPIIIDLLSKETRKTITEDDISLIPDERRENIIGALELNSNNFAVVPISNSKLGDVYDFLPFYFFQSVTSIPLEVEFWLCNIDGKLESINKVVTKNTAYEQNREEIKKLLPKVEIDCTYESTSLAAESTKTDGTLAAICSPKACTANNLKKVAFLGTYTTTFGIFRNNPKTVHTIPGVQSVMNNLLRGGNLFTGKVPARSHGEFAQILSQPQKNTLRVKWGIDPIRDSLHLGHLSNLLKLADFKALGHTIVIVLGTFTGKIGDPSGNLEQRDRLNNVQLKENADKIRRQITAILGDGIEFHENEELVKPFTIESLLKWGYKIDVRLMHDRQDFNQRRKSERAIYLSEFLYALFQTHDSIQLKVDIEVGGMDQIYNCALCRDIMVLEGIPPEFALLLKLLPGTDGGAKMSSYQQNDIRLSEPREDIRKKLLAINNEEDVLEYLRLLTRVPEETITNWENGLSNNTIDFSDIRHKMTDAVLEIIPDNLNAI